MKSILCIYPWNVGLLLLLLDHSYCFSCILMYAYNVSLQEYVSVMFVFFSSVLLGVFFYARFDKMSLNFLFTYTRRIYHKCKKWIQRYNRQERLSLSWLSLSTLPSSSSHVIHT